MFAFIDEMCGAGREGEGSRMSVRVISLLKPNINVLLIKNTKPNWAAQFIFGFIVKKS